MTPVHQRSDKPEWERVEHVDCVACPDCAFTFDACHEDRDGGYSCPLCGELRLLGALDDISRGVHGWPSVQNFARSFLPKEKSGV